MSDAVEIAPRHPPRRAPRQTGFTLIELLITVGVLVLLAAVAYPSYLRQVQRSNRTDARSALTRAANDLERFFATNGRYTADVAVLSLPSADGVAWSDGGHYEITIAAGPTGSIDTSYLLTAQPKDGGPQAADTQCASLTLDSRGQRTPDPMTAPCW